MSIGADLLRFSNRKLLFHDFESQRVNTVMDNLPFQSAFIVADRSRIHSGHNHYIHWPNYKMSEGAARVTRFNPAWVANGDDPEIALDAWESYALDPEYLIIGHNWLCFDGPLWQLWRRALNRKPDWSYLPRVIDTNLLARAFKMGWKPDRDNLLAWQYKVYSKPVRGVKTNLTQMCKDFEIPINESKTHEALYDLELNIEVYKKLIWAVEI